jgi:hypothetical protein
MSPGAHLPGDDVPPCERVSMRPTVPHPTDYVTLSQVSRRGRGEPDVAGRVLSPGLSRYAHPWCFTIDQGTTFTMAGAPIPLREVRPRAGGAPFRSYEASACRQRVS